MKKASDLIEEFWEMGERFAFSLRDATYFEGYILGVHESKIEFAMGGPLASDETYFIDVSDIDLGSLSYFCPKDRIYKDAVWCEENQEWNISASRK